MSMQKSKAWLERGESKKERRGDGGSQWVQRVPKGLKGVRQLLDFLFKIMCCKQIVSNQCQVNQTDRQRDRQAHRPKEKRKKIRKGRTQATVSKGQRKVTICDNNYKATRKRRKRAADVGELCN